MTVKIYMIILFILLYFFYILNVAGIKIKDFKCPCGIDKNNYPNEKSYKKEVKKELKAAAKKRSGKNNRIIGGTKTKYAVAWMALLKIKLKDQLVERRCGAVLINSKFLLTAAHCVCNPNMKLLCNQINGVWRPQYNITAQITAHINIKIIYDNYAMGHDTKFVEAAYAHKKFLKSMNSSEYEKNKDGPNDIAIIKLQGRINFKREPNTNEVTTMPVCMPSRYFKDTGIQATVAGYGVSDNVQRECITDDRGPDIFTRCSRKYKKGKMSKNEHNSVCEMVSKPPSKQHKICNIFNYYNRKGVPNEEAVLIPKNKNKGWAKNDTVLNGLPSELSCFPKKGEFGWCKTCDNNAIINTPGYCDPHEFYDNNDKHVPISKFDRGWGFCTKMCHTSLRKEDATTKLDVYILTEKECKEMLKYYKGERQNINTVQQLCAGVKINLFPIYYKYEKITGKKKYKFSKIAKGKEPKNPRSKKLKEGDGLNLPFHIGGKDSCRGDSGGPLWTSFNKRSYLVGLVSSGTGCAEVNRPGIYCRVKYKLDWIYKHAKSGACKNRKGKKKSRKKRKSKKKKKRRKKKKN